jgi:hypothetical protein
MLSELIRQGEIRQAVVHGVSYLWPASQDPAPDAPRVVRFLAPFDPVVWDRSRFEHLWGWAYRFEAYTPVKKRTRGYYAMPLLWCDDIVGWVNVGRTGLSRADMKVGFVRKPRGVHFRRELDAEIARLEQFLE